MRSGPRSAGSADGRRFRWAAGDCGVGVIRHSGQRPRRAEGPRPDRRHHVGDSGASLVRLEDWPNRSADALDGGRFHQPCNAGFDRLGGGLFHQFPAEDRHVGQGSAAAGDFDAAREGRDGGVESWNCFATLGPFAFDSVLESGQSLSEDSAVLGRRTRSEGAE